MRKARPKWQMHAKVSNKGVQLNLVSIVSIKISIASTTCLFFGFVFRTVKSNFFFKLTIYMQNQGFFFEFSLLSLLLDRNGCPLLVWIT
jgi:hypothetical protein